MSHEQSLQRLRLVLREMGSAVVCFSAGVDSTLLLKVAVDELGQRAVALTAISPSLPATEHAQAEALARQLGAVHVLRPSAELSLAPYTDNPVDRCYHCKTELLRVAADVAREHDARHILIGTNTDDLGDHRPGLRAAEEQPLVRHPLVEAGLGKQAVRDLSRQLGLPTWNKPELACLASRFPYGTRITAERLGRVERFEQGIAELGFAGLRVRFHDALARIELDPAQLARAVDPQVRLALVALGEQLGFKYVALDLRGYRRGAMNEVLADQPG